jgi:DNA-directed RNA polymerase subunit RPC12/RpoP
MAQLDLEIIDTRSEWGSAYLCANCSKHYRAGTNLTERADAFEELPQRCRRCGAPMRASVEAFEQWVEEQTDAPLLNRRLRQPPVDKMMAEAPREK